MAAPIVLTGLSASDPVPGNYVEVVFAQGPSSSGTATYPILLIGNRSSSGTATPDTVVYGPDTATPLATLADAATLFGLRSELYRMYKRVTSINTTTPVYAIAVTASGGTAATLTMTIATNAAANGFHRTYFADDYCDATITSGDTPTTIATAICAAINAKTEWPFTAAPVAGVITLTAAVAGLRGNWIRVASQIFGPSTIATTTSVAATGAFFSSGTTADSYTTALSTILPRRWYYIVSADDGGQSSGNLTALTAQVATQAQPVSGIRQTVLAGACDGTASNVTTIALAQNTPRCEIYHQLLSDFPPSEIAALMAGASASWEATLSGGTLNFDSFGQAQAAQAALWKITAPRAGTSFTRAQIVSALNGGVSPIATSGYGKTYLVSRITTKSQTSGVADYRIRDAHKVRICDRYADDLNTKTALQFGGFAIGDDPTQPGQRPPGSKVATPKRFLALINQQTREYAENDLVQNLATVIAQTFAQREANPSTRLTGSVPLQTADVLHQTGLQILQAA